MVGTIMDRDVEMVPCETLEITVPAEAEIVVEGYVNLGQKFPVGEVTSPSMYHLPHYGARAGSRDHRHHDARATGRSIAITRPRPTPITRRCRGCVTRRCSTIASARSGSNVKDVRFPTWGAALSCILQFDYPREGFVNDALMTAMGAPWLNTKLVVAVSPDTNIDDAREVYHAIATRCDPARDIIIVPHTRGSPYDPSARPLEGQIRWRIVGKMGIDATRKSRHDPADFERAWPVNWGKVQPCRLSLERRSTMNSRHPAQAHVLVEGRTLHSVRAAKRIFRSETQTRARAVQEADGLFAERAEALCLPAGDRRDAVEA